MIGCAPCNRYITNVGNSHMRFVLLNYSLFVFTDLVWAEWSMEMHKIAKHEMGLGVCDPW